MKRYIILLCTIVLTATTTWAQKQIFTMEGIVSDASGPLPGVTITILDKATNGTVSDINGKFTIKAERGDKLRFNYIGMKPVEYLVLEEKKNLDIQFKEEENKLDEVVVTALGSQRKISSLAAVTSVDTRQLQQPAASVANLLGGRVAGVISTLGSGEPGKNIAEFWIRGIGTFGANAKALVLIDGLEGDINSLDPADIETFSILKDASATAVYGVRGANGVILITTKRGKEDKLRVTGRASVTLNHLKRLPEYLRAYEYAQLANEARAMRGELPLYSNVEMDIIRQHSDPDMYPDVSWQDEIVKRNSWKQNYYISAQGGAKVAKYFISLGMSNEDAAYKTDKRSPYSSNVGYNTYTYRANLDMQVSPTTKVYFGTDGFFSIHTEPGIASTDYIWHAQSQLNPLRFPLIYSNGQSPAVGPEAAMSPYVMINSLGKRQKEKNSNKVTLSIEQDLSFITSGLKIRAQGAYDNISWFEEHRYRQPALYEAVGRSQKGELITVKRVSEVNSSYWQGTDRYRKYHFESTLNYDRVFQEDHRVSGLLYYYMSDEKTASQGRSNMSAIPLRYQGISSRLTYGYKDTYMVDFNFGYTGSENFQPGRRFGFFPSIAAGWIPTNYKVIKKALPFLNFFKIRASYGTVGNDRITNKRFPYLTLVRRGTSNPFGAIVGTEYLSESYIGADNLEWEKATKFNLGFEGKLLKERLEFVLDLYHDKRDGIYQKRMQIPSFVGLVSDVFSNVGKMVSYGADGNISYRHDFSKDMSLTVRGNFTYARNDIKHWDENAPAYPYQEVSGYPYNRVVGLQALGLFKDQHDIDTSPIQTFGKVLPGDIKYKDINGDGIVNDDDRVPLSYATGQPNLMYGVGAEFRYKKLSVGVLLKGTGRTAYYRGGMGYTPFFGGKMGNVLTQAFDPSNRWISKEYCEAHGIDLKYAENPNALYPRLQYGENKNNSQLSDFNLGNARYLRLQEITVSYNLNSSFIKKMGLSSIDIQFIGNNLYVWDQVKLFDPEQAQYNGRRYPIPATYTLQLYVHL